jgi:hypothetical protein
MKKTSLLTTLFIGALVLWLVSLGLFVELGQHDPYGWAVPGKESVESRDLYNARSNLYVAVGIISFLLVCALGTVRVVLSRTSIHSS